MARAELKKVRTLDLSQATENNDLDPCLFPELTGVKGLYLAPGKLDDITPLKTMTQIESLRIAATNVKDLVPARRAREARQARSRPYARHQPRPALRLESADRAPDRRDRSDGLTPLAGLAKLEMLQMKRTRITDLSPSKA